MTKLKVVTAVALISSVSSAVLSGVVTYKSYPKIKEAIESHKSLVETIVIVGKDYIPVLAGVGVAAATIIATDVIGEQKANELKSKAERINSKYQQTKTMYKDQTKAIKEEADENTQKRIEKNVRESEKIRKDQLPVVMTEKFFDPVRKKVIIATEYDIRNAVSQMNKKLTTCGVAYYEDFYGELGEDFDYTYSGYGWSYPTASAMWVDPWIEVSFKDYNAEGVGPVKLILFEADGNGNGMLPYEPQENADNSDGEWW